MADLNIDPVTRINGDASLRVFLDEEGVPAVRLQAFGYRGFEHIVRGCHLDNLLPVVSRICGGDSVFHQIASATAVERALGVTVPDGALRLRELAMWGQLFEKHAISLTVHSLPDLLFPSSDPSLRNIVSIHRMDEEVVKRLMALKSLGTDVLREAGGRAVHAVNFVPGGAMRDIDEEKRKALVKRLDEARPLLIETGHLVKMLLRRHEEAVQALGSSPTSYLALMGSGGIALTAQVVAAIDRAGEPSGQFGADGLSGALTETNSPHSHIRPAELAGVGEARVGPLARINVNRRYGTSLADEELEDVKAQWGFPFHLSMVSHAVRMLEMYHAWEKMVELLTQPPSENARLDITAAPGRGVGMVEAPEGLLVHALNVDEDGLIREFAFTVPLQFNLRSLERDLTQSARALMQGGEPEERIINLLEMTVRAYAPCITCGVH